MSGTATRLINLIMKLQLKPGQKAADLAADLEVSVRTLHRYFNMLEEIGIPVYSERGPHGGFSLVRGYKLPPLVFTPEEAVAIFLGVKLTEEMWGNLYQGAARGAMAKIENVLPDEQRKEVAWARKSLFASGLHRSDLNQLAPELEKLRIAIRESRQIDIRYRSSGQTESSDRIVDPYALAQRWGWWYLVGYCRMREAFRTFRVDRISGIRLLDEYFKPESDFDVHLYLSVKPQPEMIKFCLHFSAAYAHVALDNQPFWESIDQNPDGSLFALYLSPSLEWGVSMAMGYGPIAELVEPPEGRRMIAAWAEEISRIYRTSV